MQASQDDQRTATEMQSIDSVLSSRRDSNRSMPTSQSIDTALTRKKAEGRWLPLLNMTPSTSFTLELSGPKEEANLYVAQMEGHVREQMTVADVTAEEVELARCCGIFLEATDDEQTTQAAISVVNQMYNISIAKRPDPKLRNFIAMALFRTAQFLPGYTGNQDLRSVSSTYSRESSVDGDCADRQLDAEVGYLSPRSNLSWSGSGSDCGSPRQAATDLRMPAILQHRSSWTAGVWLNMRGGRLKKPRSTEREARQKGRRAGSASGGRSILQKFRLVCPITKGAYGRVFLAKERATELPCALKVLRKKHIVKKNMTKAVFRERDLMELMSHMDPGSQHVVHVYQTFQTDFELFIVMELMPGGDLMSLLLDLGVFSEPLTRQFAAEIVLALDFLHKMGIIHRDLKPDNILMDAAGHLKLTDFGLSEAKASTLVFEPIDPGSPLHKSPGPEAREARGTIDYMAPEIILQQPHDYTVDWWSLGVIIVEFLTGCPPFNDDCPSSVCQNILQHDINWEGTPETAVPICSLLLQFDPKVRLGARGGIEVMSHPYFEGLDWETVKTGETLYTPQPYSVPEQCTVNFESRQEIYPFTKSDELQLIETSGSGDQTASDDEDLRTFQEFSLEVEDLESAVINGSFQAPPPKMSYEEVSALLDYSMGTTELAASPISPPYQTVGLKDLE
uniref:non-specific serine/threonine protein kinase n=1 Tax=Eutreptiella gymnastica TaxID=73025 RepID=A0A7S1I7S8_9EUGL|mmetsp:Transcript_136870/g.237811  ORF Transcript_136870/g.237811 Transcript_136870/m.237811 type:complete len:678 (+) Transcript_136870:131-2164(+)